MEATLEQGLGAAFGRRTRYNYTKGSFTVAAFRSDGRLVSVKSALYEDEAQVQAVAYARRADVTDVRITEAVAQ